MVVMDVWGGDNSDNHVARFIREIDDALKLSRKELDLGYLVNLRAEAAWGRYTEFDERGGQMPSVQH
jgi:hypothetical protein